MYNNEDVRYRLERYRAGGSNRYVCPQCHQGNISVTIPS